MSVEGTRRLPRTLGAWRRDTSPIYQALFLAALLVLGSSFVAGFVESLRLFGLPPIHGDATILGRTLLERGEYATALDEFRLAGLIDPENYDARPQLDFSTARSAPGSAAQRGRTSLAAGRWVEAERALREALASDPQPELHDLLGFALYELGKREEAAQQFERARALRAPHAERTP